MQHLSVISTTRRRVALLLAGSLVAAACGGTGAGGGPAEDDDDAPEPGAEVEAETDDGAGAPQPGGRLVYGLEAETDDGWCVTDSQLAISGIQVARAIYDTLTVPDSTGGVQPHLAESVEPDEDFTEWVITLRDEDIRFHDGSDLTAEVVKNNLDAYRGFQDGDHNRNALLFFFVFQDIEDVEVTGEREVTVTMERPWVAFDNFLYGSGRIGIMAQAQLDDETSCDTNPIGTGPFELADWQLNQRTLLTKNQDYWRTDEDGTQLPYLDELEFRPIPEVEQRSNALRSDEIDAMHTSNPPVITEMRELADAGEANLVESDDFAEVSHIMLNAGEPPFDNVLARQAVASALDAEEVNEVINLGVPRVANGPFAPGAVGHVDDTGFPLEQDLERARELAEQYEEETGEPLTFQIASVPQPEIVRLVALMRQMLDDAGIETTTTTFDQAQLISTAVGGDFQWMNWRNFPGFDPDGLYVWWHSGDPDDDEATTNPVNLGRINDPEIDRLLDEGRVTADENERVAIYEELNRRFGEQAYLLWGWWTIWTVPSATDVHGVVGGRPVGTDGSEDYTGLAVGHDPALLWREQ